MKEDRSKEKKEDARRRRRRTEKNGEELGERVEKVERSKKLYGKEEEGGRWKSRIRSEEKRGEEREGGREGRRMEEEKEERGTLENNLTTLTILYLEFVTPLGYVACWIISMSATLFSLILHITSRFSRYRSIRITL